MTSKTEVGTMKFNNAFLGKRVFITGHTGFKGSWLALWLEQLGAQVYGYALPPPTDPSNFVLARVENVLTGHVLADIRDAGTLATAVAAASPDIVFHLAAQPLVRASYEAPRETFDTNVLGTVCLLDAVRELDKPCAIVVVTSDKCYENKGHVWGYRECDAMGGSDPYSASKAATELVVASYRQSFFHPSRLGKHGKKLATVRAGNVIGGGDWARDRIVTDIVEALVAGKPIAVRNPHAIRPWQHVLEPLSGYLTLAATMLSDDDPKWCSGWNFGPIAGGEFTVGALANEFISAWGSGSWQDRTLQDQPYEAAVLRLCIDKARGELGWHPIWDCSETVSRTVRWYHRVLIEKQDAHQECMADIEDYSMVKM